MAGKTDFKRKLTGLRRTVMDTVFPWNTCLFCGGRAADSGCLCEACAEKIAAYRRCRVCGCFFEFLTDREHSLICPFCRKEQKKYIDAFYAALPYCGKPRDLILALKYREQKKYARPLGSCLAEYLTKQNIQADFIVAVPLHENRLAERGYNQSELLAEVVSENLGIPVLPGALKRHKETKVQHRLSFNERKINLADAFSAGGRCKTVFGSSILLIDDIMTSGTTFVNCAKVLKQQGASKVYAASVASHVVKL